MPRPWTGVPQCNLPCFEKMSPEDRKAWQDGLASTTVPDSRRSFHFLARITHYAQK
jgi:hypothetical protein